MTDYARLTDHISRRHNVLPICVIAKHLGMEPRHIVEVGVYKSQGAVSWRREFPDAHLWLVDPWQAREPKFSIYRENPEQADWDALHLFNQKFWWGDERAHIMRCTSGEAAELMRLPLDIVYLDGLHDYENVRDDIRRWLPLVTRGGIISGHDYSHGRGHGGVIQAVDEAFGDDKIVCERQKVWAKIIP